MGNPFRFPLLVRIPIRKASFSQTIRDLNALPNSLISSVAYLNSLPLLELGTNSPRPSPGEVLSFLAFHQLTVLILSKWQAVILK